MNAPQQLYNAYLDGKSLGEEEVDHLNRWVEADAANALWVVDLGFLHEHLDDLLSIPRLLEELANSKSESEQADLGAILDQVEGLAPIRRGRPHPPAITNKRAIPIRWVTLALAASVLVVVGGGLAAAYWLRDGARRTALIEPETADRVLQASVPAPPAIVA
ncbi:MAG: hypothetical protein KDA37_14820, partial [Planctomycetales bacterium]|nr:hypothetical protein [Planctomycetales bacterium]